MTMFDVINIEINSNNVKMVQHFLIQLKCRNANEPEQTLIQHQLKNSATYFVKREGWGRGEIMGQISISYYFTRLGMTV